MAVELIKLNRSCIDDIIYTYFLSLSQLRTPIQNILKINDIYQLLKSLKRDPVGTGPYVGVSVFENCNRIFSDMVILIGVRRLLFDLQGIFPFDEYKAALGTQQGVDIQADKMGITLVGEAFSVAKSFFQGKKSMVWRTLEKSDANYKIVMFNSDAVNSPSNYDLVKRDGIYTLVIDVEESLKNIVPSME